MDCVAEFVAGCKSQFSPEWTQIRARRMLPSAARLTASEGESVAEQPDSIFATVLIRAYTRLHLLSMIHLPRIIFTCMFRALESEQRLRPGEISQTLD